jgi:hypothetical protein
LVVERFTGRKLKWMRVIELNLQETPRDLRPNKVFNRYDYSGEKNVETGFGVWVPWLALFCCSYYKPGIEIAVQ